MSEPTSHHQLFEKLMRIYEDLREERDAAVLAERERCAKIAEGARPALKYKTALSSNEFEVRINTCNNIARMIRKPGRGEVKDPIDLTTPYSPCGIYYPVSDRYEIALEAGATFVRHVSGTNVYEMRRMDDKALVGLGVECAKATFK